MATHIYALHAPALLNVNIDDMLHITLHYFMLTTAMS